MKPGDVLRRLRARPARAWTVPALAVPAAAALAATGGWPAWAGAGGLLLFGAVHAAGTAAGSVEGWFHRVRPDPAFRALDERMRAELGGRPSLSNDRYDALVGYFAAGVRSYRSPGCALVTYPGLPGTRGLRSEGFEGFARTAPLLAAWVATRGDSIPLPDGTRFDAFGHLVAGLRAGTDPASAEYWGTPVDFDQRIVEAGDVALLSWMLRDRLQAALPAQARAALLDWLGKAAARKVYGGNWHLFCLVAGLAREAWGQPPDPATRRHYADFKRSHLGEGWFFDGRNREVDYYNAWQMHYLLHFASRMDPALDGDFAKDALARFAAAYAHLIAPAGVPIFGRSVCYRTAVPTPLVLASTLPGAAIRPGLARRALDAVWSHFIAQGALADGTFTQGYEGAAPELLENYCGRASSLWGLRSLVAAYWQPPGGGIWTAGPEPLPVERHSYDLTIAPAGLRVLGDAGSGSVEVQLLRNAGRADAPLQRLGPLRRLAQVALRRPLRPSNFAAKYERASYRSDRPFYR